MTTTQTTMEPRLELSQLARESYRAMIALDRAANEAATAAGVAPALQELLRVRASQINGCAYCIDMHTKDARHGGESELRLYALNAWRETPFFDDRERAALALLESVTLVGETHVPDEVWEQAAEQFDQEALAALVFLAVTINAWNRIGVSARLVPGEYEPGG